MARPFYGEVPDGIFHITSRGNARRTIFLDDRDHRIFLAELQRTMRRHRWRCLGYCLMPNHFHLLVQTPDPTLADGTRDLKSNYARTHNWRHGKDGHLFKTGFRRQLIQDDSYLVTAAVYIARNPVRAGLVRDATEWPWSSFGALPAFVDDGLILGLLADDAATGRRRFEEQVLAQDGMPFDVNLPIVGDEDFVRRHAPKDRPGHEVLKRIWEQARPPLSELADGTPEPEFVRLARETFNYTVREIAEHLGCSTETVRRRLRMWDV